MTAMVLDAPLNRLQGARGDMRSFARFSVRLTVTAWAVAMVTDDLEEGMGELALPREAPMRDMSISGLCFVSDLPYPVGTVLGLTLDLDGMVVSVQAVVRRVSAQSVGEAQEYHCGAQFSRCEETNAAIPRIAQYLLKLSTKDVARAA